MTGGAGGGMAIGDGGSKADLRSGYDLMGATPREHRTPLGSYVGPNPFAAADAARERAANEEFGFSVGAGALIGMVGAFAGNLLASQLVDCDTPKPQRSFVIAGCMALGASLSVAGFLIWVFSGSAIPTEPERDWCHH